MVIVPRVLWRDELCPPHRLVPALRRVRSADALVPHGIACHFHVFCPDADEYAALDLAPAHICLAPFHVHTAPFHAHGREHGVCHE